MKKPRKIIIIKTGFSEFLDRGLSTTVSLGDVLSCTAILHLYKNDRVTWVTSWEAQELLVDNAYIHRLLVFGPDMYEQLLSESCDVLINLEKDMGICAFIERIKAKERYGFYFNRKNHNIASFNESTRFLLAGQENQTEIHKNLIEILFESVGATWKGEGPVMLRRKRRSSEQYDVGFNYSVGSKWPTKAWPDSHWKSLEKILKGQKYSVSWQQGHESLKQYIEWIDSCRLIVTSDSLGQAIGQALGKQVITLFGPTNAKRMARLPNLTTISSTLKCPFIPCYLPICKYHKFCMDYIEPQTVAKLCDQKLQELLVTK